MWPLPDPWRASAIACEAWLGPYGSPALRQALRERRLDALMRAAAATPFYRERFARHGSDFEAQPALTKSELMARFDDAVTDPRLSLHALREFVADPSRIGQPFAGEYAVWESSGSSGVPGIFVQDAAAMQVYDLLEALRRPTASALRRWLDPLAAAQRLAFVGAVDGHFASNVSVERLRAMVPALADGLRSFSFLQPVAKLVTALNRWQPTQIATYPTAALLLAEEAAAGRLRLNLSELQTGGEALTEAMRGVIGRAFGCPVWASYGASEFLCLGAECEQARLHLNSDWALLEPVDRQGRALPAGEEGCTTLLTNLANHVQPLIRYDLGDRVRIDPAPCACGSALPVIEVQGRVDDALRVPGEGGAFVRLLPLALTTVLEDEAQVFDFQLAQRGPASLRLTLACAADDDPALRRAHDALAAYLRLQGAPGVRLEVRRGVLPKPSRSGKRPRVLALAEPPPRALGARR